MLEITLLAEDDAQERLIGALIRRLAQEERVPTRLRVRSAYGGLPKVLRELALLARDVERGLTAVPDVVVVALDANCKGVDDRRARIQERAGSLRDKLVCAVPDPHVERWFLVDGAAFKEVLGRGCEAPDQKCEKDRYKRLLVEAIRAAAVEPLLGGVEYAEDLAAQMDLRRAARTDAALGAFLSAMQARLRQR